MMNLLFENAKKMKNLGGFSKKFRQYFKRWIVKN